MYAVGIYYIFYFIFTYVIFIILEHLWDTVIFLLLVYYGFL